MKRARTRLQSRIKPIKGYQQGGESEEVDPLDRAVDESTAFVPIERAIHGLGEFSNHRDVVDRLQHPSYQQLADDKDLRRGRTRMAPRGAGAEGGFGYARGGPVIPPELHEYHQHLQQGGRAIADDPIPRNIVGGAMPAQREPLQIPIGRGQLTINPEYQPEQTMGGSARYELPVGDKGWSVGAQGQVDRYIGPGYEQTPVQGGGGFFVRKTFRKGGRVNKFQQGARVPGQNDPDPTNDVMANASSSNVLERMSPWKRDWIARGEVPGYAHLQADAEQMEPSAYARETPYAKDKAESNAYYNTRVGTDSFPQYRRGGRVKKFQDGGDVQMAEKGDIRKGREFRTHIGDPDEEFESMGYIDDSRGVNQKVSPEDWPDWRYGTSTGDNPAGHSTIEWWRKRPKREVPTSAIDTRYAKRGGVIKNYQAGGWTEDAQGNPIVQPTEAPQQPASGAAGQATPATPPPVTGPVTPPPTPTQAIATQPKEFVDPLAGFKDDADVEKEKQAEQTMVSGGRYKTVHPSGDVLQGSPPPDRVPQQHAEYDRLQDLIAMFPEVQKQDTSKTQRYVKEAQQTITALERRVHNETTRANEQQRRDWARTHASEVKVADEKRRVGIMQIPDLDRQVSDFAGQLDLTYPNLIANAKTPEAKRDYSLLQAATPTKTMKPNEISLVTRSLLNLNHGLGQQNVANLLYELAMPPVRGQTGFNGLTGKAAANFEVGTKDPVGNYVIHTAMGPWRIDPMSYGLIKNARLQGYEFMTNAHNDYIKAKRDEDKPGFVARTTDAAIDTVRGLFK